MTFARINSNLFCFRFTPSELTSVGDVIGQVKAVDIDEDSQSEVFYTIAGVDEKGVLQNSYCRFPSYFYFL